MQLQIHYTTQRRLLSCEQKEQEHLCRTVNFSLGPTWTLTRLGEFEFPWKHIQFANHRSLIVLTKGATFAIASTCFLIIGMTLPNPSMNDSICSKVAMRVHNWETWPTGYCCRSFTTRQIQRAANWAIWGDRNQFHRSCVCTWWPQKAESLYLPVHLRCIKSSTPWNCQWSDRWMLSPSISSIQ